MLKVLETGHVELGPEDWREDCLTGHFAIVSFPNHSKPVVVFEFVNSADLPCNNLIMPEGVTVFGRAFREAAYSRSFMEARRQQPRWPNLPVSKAAYKALQRHCD